MRTIKFSTIKKHLEKNLSKNRSVFVFQKKEQRNPARTSRIYKDGFFSFPQEHLQFPRRKTPNLFCIIGCSVSHIENVWQPAKCFAIYVFYFIEIDIQGGSQKLLLTTKESIVSSSIFSPPCSTLDKHITQFTVYKLIGN